MEQTLETNAARLLDGVADIIKRNEAPWQNTGEKYNLFKVARIVRKELIICRVLADLMDPRGKHGQGSLYLKLFWEIVLSRLPIRPALSIEHTRVTTEDATEKNRRIDITLDDRRVFVPIEVKIGARDQPNQLADYFKCAQTKNRNGHIPALYLTIDGREPTDLSKDGIGSNDYARLSFKENILPWLEACLREEATEKTVPVRENLKQLIAAVKSLCGKPEDAEMEDAIFKQITKDDEAIRTALAISGAANFRERVLKTFTGEIFTLVKASFPNAALSKITYGYDWHYIEIPVRGGNYLLQVNYDWTSAWLSASDSCKADSASPEWAILNKKMRELFKLEGESVPKERLVWRGEDMSWPSLESYVNNDERDLYLARLSKLSSQEAVDRIVSMARTLEEAVF
jgi:hypothetical protein